MEWFTLHIAFVALAEFNVTRNDCAWAKHVKKNNKKKDRVSE